MTTQLFKINPAFARYHKLPILFAAIQLRETSRAVYLFGRGTTESARLGYCCICGRTLTHPVSVELGIGPECGRHYWDWNLVGGYTKENIARLTQKIHEDIRVDSWFPKTVIEQRLPAEETITFPTDHPVLQQRENPAKTASMVTYQQTGELAVKITFPFNPKDVDQVKSLPGRRFHNEGTSKYWTAPLELSTAEKLRDWGFLLDEKLEEYIQKMNTPATTVDDMEGMNIPGLRMQLFPFQQRGVSFIENRNGRALVADEMGLGKTAQALAWLQLHPELRPAIVVVPASLKLNWKKEAEMWMDCPNVQILTGTTPTMPIIGEILVINYDILDEWVETLQSVRPQVLITDECHYYKNNSAQRTKAVKRLGKGIRHIIALSGTPIVNRPVEAYNALRLIDSQLFPSFWTYAQKYCGARHNGYGWDFNGATNTEELHDKLAKSVMIRRLKKDVLTDLPDKLRSFLPMELDNERDYQRAEQDFIGFIREQKGREAALKASNAEALAAIEGLKQLAVAGKMKQAIDWIRDFIEVDGKLVVFAVHKFVIDRLIQEFGDIAVKVDGSVGMDKRQEAVDQFQNNDKVRLFVGNIKAAGVGLTLTASSNVAFLELPWTPGDLTQAEDRIHRIGQHYSVTIHYLLASGTIEERIARLIDRKRKVLDSVLDGQVTEEESLLTELMNQYNN